MKCLIEKMVVRDQKIEFNIKSIGNRLGALFARRNQINARLTISKVLRNLMQGAQGGEGSISDSDHSEILQLY